MAVHGKNDHLSTRLRSIVEEAAMGVQRGFTPNISEQRCLTGAKPGVSHVVGGGAPSITPELHETSSSIRLDGFLTSASLT